MNQTLAPAEDEVRGALRDLDADLKACLALNRATLQALATLSPLLGAAADAALEEEGEAAARGASRRVGEVVEAVRERLQRAPAEARIAIALRRALTDAADALPCDLPARRESSAA